MNRRAWREICRETWRSRVVLKEFTEEDFNQPSKGPPSDLFPERRRKDFPPPFQKLCEEHKSYTK